MTFQGNDGIDAFRDLPHPPKSLQPVKKMLLQEMMHLVAVQKLSIALLKMLNPVEACILKVWRKIMLYSTIVHLSYEHTGRVYSADVALE